MVTGTVELIADVDDALGAHTDTQLAALAELRVDFHGGNLNGGFVDHEFTSREELLDHYDPSKITIDEPQKRNV